MDVSHAVVVDHVVQDIGELTQQFVVLEVWGFYQLNQMFVVGKLFDLVVLWKEIDFVVFGGKHAAWVAFGEV